MSHLSLWAFLLATCLAQVSIPSRTYNQGNVEITETTFPTTAAGDLTLNFASSDDKIVYGLTPDGELYHSENEGKSWTLHSVPELMDGIDKCKGKVGYVFVSSSEPTVAYFVCKDASKLMLWVTTNNGANYTLQEDESINKPVKGLRIHPKIPSTLVILVSGVFDQYVIHSSTNYGANWTKLANIPQLGRVEWSKQDQSRLYFNRLISETTQNPWDSELVWTDEHFSAPQKLPSSPVNVFHWFWGPKMTLGVITCIDAELCNKKQMQLSTDGGNTWQVSVFPDSITDTKEETNYYVWDISEQTVWTYVERFCADKAHNTTDDLCWGDLFHSGLAKQNYVLSLRYVRHHQFNAYESIPGIYIANQYLTQDSPSPQDPIRTLITYNKGSTWDLVPAPELDALQQSTNCKIQEGCSLHLHSRDTEDKYTDYLYSVPNAVGLMVGSGNIGRTLRNRMDDVALYFSINGGVEWSEVRKGRWIYEIGDHGSVVIAAPLGKPTDNLIYTNNDGDTWNDLKLGVFPFKATNIRVGSGWDSATFLVHGIREIIQGGQNSTSIVLLQVNLVGSFSGKCSESNGDFEDWSPKDEHGNCVMGHKTTFRRRKYGRTCYLGQEFNRTITTENCPCSLNDFECDHCYKRDDLASTCVWECGEIPDPPTPEFCKNSTSQSPTFYRLAAGQGYTKVEEDTCNEAAMTEAKPAALVPCNAYNANQTSHQPWWEIFTEVDVIVPALLVIFLFIVLVVGIVWYCYRHNDSFKDLCGPSSSTQDYGLVGDESSSFRLTAHPQGYGQGTSLLSDLESELEDSDLDLDV